MTAFWTNFQFVGVAFCIKVKGVHLSACPADTSKRRQNLNILHWCVLLRYLISKSLYIQRECFVDANLAQIKNINIFSMVSDLFKNIFFLI